MKQVKLRLLSGLFLLLLGTPFQIDAAPIRGTVHGMTSSELRKLKQLPTKPLIPGTIPSGYLFKRMDVVLKPQASYLLEYRCFCAGQNYMITVIGSTQIKPAKASKWESVPVKTLGRQIKIGQFPAGQGIESPYYLTEWLGKGPFKMAVLSAVQGKRAPYQDFVKFVKNLEYMK